MTWENYVCLRLNVPRHLCSADDEHLLVEDSILMFSYTVPDGFHKYFDDHVPYLVVYETGENHENPHFHATFRLIGKMQAFRQYLLRNGFKGNQCYSLKAADPEKMDAHLDYLCKGTGTGKEDGPKVVDSHKDFTEAVIKERHNAFWKKNQEIADRKPKRKREEPASKVILAICKQKLEHDPSKLAISEDELIDITLEWYKSNKWSMNVFQMKAVVNYVSYSLNPQSNRVDLMRNQLKFN